MSTPNLALFCDFENVAIGVRDAKLEEFDIQLVLERLLDKGNIVLKKAYADWGRYKTAKRPLHEAAFEMIEIPHASFSGKNSADIRLVVDALDLCYTKPHVDTFVIISGDSDFSPLVSKLRENAKKVIGLGVKNSTSELLVDNCDEFIVYDDLVVHRRKTEKKAEKRQATTSKPRDSKKAKAAGDDEGKERALELILDTVEALFRDQPDRVWGSMVKQTIKRKRPSFSETAHGYRSFNQLLEDAQAKDLLELQKDDRSGGYIILGFGPEA